MNKKIGNDTEKKCLQLLQKMGYWCHLFSYNKNGQPCDIVAIKNDEAYLIDVKHCESDRFGFNRIEPNQRNCFEYAETCGNKNMGFFIYFENHECFNFVHYWAIKEMEAFGRKSYQYDETRSMK